jgi:hypothetical protein
MESSYAAGLFDGEGTVVISKHVNQRGIQTMLKIHMNDPRPLKALFQKYGGSFKEVVSRPGTFLWMISGEQSELFAQDILSFSITKREQLELYLEVRSTLDRKRRIPYTDEENNRLSRWVSKAKELRATPVALEV